MRNGDWKLIRFFEDGHEELYNAKEDIGETKNLVGTEPEKRVELSAKLSAWQEKIEGLGAPLDSRALSRLCAMGRTGGVRAFWGVKPARYNREGHRTPSRPPNLADDPSAARTNRRCRMVRPGPYSPTIIREPVVADSSAPSITRCALRPSRKEGSGSVSPRIESTKSRSKTDRLLSHCTRGFTNGPSCAG